MFGVVNFSNKPILRFYSVLSRFEWIERWQLLAVCVDKLFQQDADGVRKQALRLLAVREYGFCELINRLKQRGCCYEDAYATVEWLRDQGMQNDDRFAEAYVRGRLQRGFGPLRITQELRNKNISDTLIAAQVNMSDEQWIEHLSKVREGKYGKPLPVSDRDKMKQYRFLQYRGFSNVHISRLFRVDSAC